MSQLPVPVQRALERARAAEALLVRVPESRRAVLVLAEHDRDAKLDAELSYAAAHGYSTCVATLHTAIGMLAADTADVIVAYAEHDLSPFVEVVSAPRRPRPVVRAPGVATATRAASAAPALDPARRRPLPLRGSFGD